MVKVKNLKIGEKIKYNKNCNVFVREIKSDRVIVTKHIDGFGFMSLPFSSHKFQDLQNRVEYV